MELLSPDPFLIFWTISSLASFVTLVWVLVNRFPNIRLKIAWILISLVPVLGPVIYFTIGRRQNVKIN